MVNIYYTSQGSRLALEINSIPFISKGENYRCSGFTSGGGIVIQRGLEENNNDGKYFHFCLIIVNLPRSPASLPGTMKTQTLSLCHYNM